MITLFRRLPSYQPHSKSCSPFAHARSKASLCTPTWLSCAVPPTLRLLAADLIAEIDPLLADMKSGAAAFASLCPTPLILPSSTPSTPQPPEDQHLVLSVPARTSPWHPSSSTRARWMLHAFTPRSSLEAWLRTSRPTTLSGGDPSSFLRLHARERLTSARSFSSQQSHSRACLDFIGVVRRKADR